jgi:D-arabinose 1-dehydrogenase-like Zn-dependent alcohol dehydrogenase
VPELWCVWFGSAGGCAAERDNAEGSSTMGGVMKAVQYQQVGAKPVVVEVPKPEPGPGQVLLQVTAAGMCHSDIEVMSWPAERLPFELPLTLGHEGVGTVAELGPGVRGVTEGDSVAVYGPWGCGVCRNCAQGKENYCTDHPSSGGGLGAEVVLDFVGAAATVQLAAQSVAVEGDITIVGIAGAPLPVGFGLLPHEVSVAAPYWGSRAELIEVLDLARAGAVRAHVETFGLDETPEVYDRFHDGQIRGRAVIVP